MATAMPFRAGDSASPKLPTPKSACSVEIPASSPESPASAPVEALPSATTPTNVPAQYIFMSWRTYASNYFVTYGAAGAEIELPLDDLLHVFAALWDRHEGDRTERKKIVEEAIKVLTVAQAVYLGGAAYRGLVAGAFANANAEPLDQRGLELALFETAIVQLQLGDGEGLLPILRRALGLGISLPASDAMAGSLFPTDERIVEPGTPAQLVPTWRELIEELRKSKSSPLAIVRSRTFSAIAKLQTVPRTILNGKRVLSTSGFCQQGSSGDDEGSYWETLAAKCVGRTAAALSDDDWAAIAEMMRMEGRPTDARLAEAILAYLATDNSKQAMGAALYMRAHRELKRGAPRIGWFARKYFHEHDVVGVSKPIGERPEDIVRREVMAPLPFLRESHYRTEWRHRYSGRELKAYGDGAIASLPWR